MNWIWISVIVYIVLLLLVCIRIIFETHSSTKTIAYLLFCIFAPVIGIFFYTAFGINFWRKRLYTKKAGSNDKLLKELKTNFPNYASAAVTKEEASTMQNAELAAMVIKDIESPLTRCNKVKLLVNGEEKFPELLRCLAEAERHIHMEYYIFEADEIGSKVIKLLIKKAQEGVQVRFIYDDFGSPGINKKIEERMRDAGIEIYPFQKVFSYIFANRLYYRNHRKIVVIDGRTAFTGGINVSDKYINNKKNKLFWRDTHLRIDGPGVFYLQYLFLTDWNFCSKKLLKPEQFHFAEDLAQTDDTYVQIVGSGPDSVQPSVLFSILQAIYLAKKEILITTPYFIPGDDIMNALRIAASSGLSVKLLVPGKCDSRIVNAASKANYNDLLIAGVEIYLYQKGFVHAKTLVTDGKLTIIGTSNMDYRSFELNFEVNAMVYDTAFSEKLRKVFFDDLTHAKKINADQWYKRPVIVRLGERLARLLSPSL